MIFTACVLVFLAFGKQIYSMWKKEGITDGKDKPSGTL